jgi:hypothetical protein
MGQSMLPKGTIREVRYERQQVSGQTLSSDLVGRSLRQLGWPRFARLRFAEPR